MFLDRILPEEVFCSNFREFNYRNETFNNRCAQPFIVIDTVISSRGRLSYQQIHINVGAVCSHIHVKTRNT